MKDEFYYANEYNSTTEYKHFPAEVYITRKEVGDVGKETSDCGAEITTTSKKPTPKKAEHSGGIVDKILNSLKGAAVTSSVAAVVVLGAVVVAPPPKVELINLSVGENYVEYEMSVDELQDDLQYFIVVSTSNEADRLLAVEEEGVYQNIAEGLKTEWEYTLSFVAYDDAWGKTVYFEKTFQTTAVAEVDYQVDINGVTAVGLNEFRVDFSAENLDETCAIELWLTYDGEEGESVPIAVTARDLAYGYVTVSVLESVEILSVLPVITYGEAGKTLECEPYEQSLENSFSADVQVDTVNGNVYLYLKGATGGGTQINVIDATTLELVVQQELFNNSVLVPYGGEPSVEYIVYMTNEQGERTTNEFAAAIDTTVQETGEYTFNYKNCGDAGITYNDDGTINVYIQTDFSSEDERLYYQITLGTMRFQSRDPLFVAKGLPNDNYSLTYDICYDDNGVQYSISKISVSGTVNEFYAQNILSVGFLDGGFRLSVSGINSQKVDLNSVRAVTSSGEEIHLLESDFVYDAEHDEYVADVSLMNTFETLTLYVKCGPYASNMQGIDGYEGNLFNEISITFD